MILFGPIYIFVVAGYVWVTILDIYKSLANNRRGNIIRDYPHVFVDSFKETDGVKEYRTFLRIPDSEWEKREKEMVRRAEEQNRHEEYINSELAEIERLAPHGVETWLKKNNINAIRREDNQEDNNSDYRATLSIPKLANREKVVKSRDEILQLEALYEKSIIDNEWLKEQNNFTTLIYEKKGANNKNFFNYSKVCVPVNIAKPDGETQEIVKIARLYINGYCEDTSLDYTFFPRFLNVTKYLSGEDVIENEGPYLENKLYQRIYVNSFISLIKEIGGASVFIYDSELIGRLYDELVDSMLENTEDTSSKKRFNTKHERTSADFLQFLYFAIRSAQSSYSSIEELDSIEDVKSRKDGIIHNQLIIITDRLRTNEIITLSQEIWSLFPSKRPCIFYLSLYEDIAPKTMRFFIDKKFAEEEKKRKEQELIDSIPSKVDGWEMLPTTGGLRIKYLLDYYPTTVEFEADDDEWNDRWTVWYFKNDPEKTPEKAHQHVLDRVIPKFVGILNETFGEESLKYLTLVCIPASTQAENDSRYKEFSERLCRETGMENGYEHTHVIREKTAKRKGGEEGNVNYSFDDSFFNGKRVILLDDIITKGNSMRIAKAILQKQGAKVICGLAVGKTRHERRENMPEEEYA